MVVDACLLLWSRCKTVFQRFQTGSTDNPKYLQKMENPSKVSNSYNQLYIHDSDARSGDQIKQRIYVIIFVYQFNIYLRIE